MITTLSPLPSLDALMQSAAKPSTVATPDQGAGDTGIFDNLWLELAKLTGQADPAAITAATSSAAATPAASSAASSSGSSSSGLSSFGSLVTWAADLVNRDTPDQGGVSLEDIVLILVGLILLAAAVVGLVFTFDATQKTAAAITKQARGVVDAKAAAKLAELAA